MTRSLLLVTVLVLTLSVSSFPQNQMYREPKSPGTGLEISFCQEDGEPRLLEYHCVNLSDPMLRKRPGFFKYLERDCTFVTYLKGASYLLHKTYFSRIRKFILSRSKTVVQDDSGIALHYFTDDKRTWKFDLFGKYTEPVSLFRKCFQPDLDSLYQMQGARRLGFGIGYNYRDRNSNLMIARPQ